MNWDALYVNFHSHLEGLFKFNILNFFLIGNQLHENFNKKKVWVLFGRMIRCLRILISRNILDIMVLNSYSKVI